MYVVASDLRRRDFGSMKDPGSDKSAKDFDLKFLRQIIALQTLEMFPVQCEFTGRLCWPIGQFW